jgi:hypothetical protein
MDHLSINSLIEGIALDLIHCGRGLIVQSEIHNAVGIKIADADGLERAFLAKFLHRAPRSINIAVGLVKEVEVEIVELEPLKRVLRGALCPLKCQAPCFLWGYGQSPPIAKGPAIPARSRTSAAHIKMTSVAAIIRAER